MCAVERLVEETPAVILKARLPVRDIEAGSSFDTRVHWLHTSDGVPEQLDQWWLNHRDRLYVFHRGYASFLRQRGARPLVGHDGQLTCQVTLGLSLGQEIRICTKGLGVGEEVSLDRATHEIAIPRLLALSRP